MKEMEPEARACCVDGNSRELGSGNSSKEAEGLPSWGPSWAPASDFLYQVQCCPTPPSTFRSVPRVGREGALGLQTCGPQRDCSPG